MTPPKHSRILSLSSRKLATSPLTAAQRQMYASETLQNFRWIYKLLAKPSKHVLSNRDLISPVLQNTLSIISQFAEIGYGFVSPYVIFAPEILDMLLEPTSRICATGTSPLEDYDPDSLRGAVCVASMTGTTAGTHCMVVYRPTEKQVVVGISGTSTPVQALYDVHAAMHFLNPTPGDGFGGRKGCAAHAGFWDIHKGLVVALTEAVKRALEAYEVDELIITGHSLGGALSYLFTHSLLESTLTAQSTADTTRLVLPSSLRLTLAAFGAPRPGNTAFARRWHALSDAYRTRNAGQDAFNEYNVKAYADGVSCLPPLLAGYRHFSRRPYYFVHGKMYAIPPSEAEFNLFHVDGESDTDDDAVGGKKLIVHPRGGHNYHNGRDMEKSIRRMKWLDKTLRKTVTASVLLHPSPSTTTDRAVHVRWSTHPGIPKTRGARGRGHGRFSSLGTGSTKPDENGVVGAVVTTSSSESNRAVVGREEEEEEPNSTTTSESAIDAGSGMAMVPTPPPTGWEEEYVRRVVRHEKRDRDLVGRDE